MTRGRIKAKEAEYKTRSCKNELSEYRNGSGGCKEVRTRRSDGATMREKRSREKGEIQVTDDGDTVGTREVGRGEEGEREGEEEEETMG